MLHTIPNRKLHTINHIQYGLFLKYYNIWGHYGPPPNFVASRSIMIKFGVLMEFDKFSPK